MVNLEDFPGEPKLHAAVRKGDHDLVVKLLENHKTEQRTGFCTNIASTVGHFLLRNIISIDAKNSRGETALHIAAHLNRFEHVKTLLEHGADANLRTPGNNTPLDLAVNSRCYEASEIFLNQAAKTNTNKHENLLHIAVKLNKPGLVDELLDRGVDVNVKNELGETPLHSAVASKNVEPDMIKKLVERGADVNAKDMKGDTPLYSAMRHGRCVARGGFVVAPVPRIEVRGLTKMH